MKGRLAVVVGVALGSFGCGRTQAVAFQGSSAPSRVAAEQVLETDALPRGARWLGRVVARCRPLSEQASFEDEALFDVDCSETRLRSLLREGAAAAGGDVLSEVTCSESSIVTCRALVSRLLTRPSGLESARPIEPTLREAVGNARVSFIAANGVARPAPRSSALVSDQPNPLPSQVSLGCLRVRCESCSTEDAHDAMRVAAARVGGSQLVSAHCAVNALGTECVADVGVNEND